MQVQLIRHATLVVEYNRKKLLVDPMFSPAESADPIQNTPNQRRNPLVELPDQPGAITAGLDAVFVTHTHFDHWDTAAQQALPKDIPVFCQPTDLEKIRGQGFREARAVADALEWEGIRIRRTGGQHGVGEIGKRMGTVSGFILEAPREPTAYIAGDTIWCAEVSAALENAAPQVVIVNAGAAQFHTGGPITMTADDVLAVGQAASQATVIAVHLEAINHCILGRSTLEQAAAEAGLGARVKIPLDGERLTFG